MSDKSSLPWQRWQPNDLGQLNKPKIEEIVEEEQPEEPFNRQQFELEQLQTQVRSEAQGLGYAEGQQKGFAEGQKAGYDAGFQQGLAEAQQQQAPLQARMQQLVSEFNHTLEALDSVIAARLMQLALEAARQVIGQAPHVDGTALLRQIQGMIQQEPMLSGKPTLRVHPDDLQRVEQTLGATLSLHGWRLMADSTIHPGGCKVSAEDGDLDASLATRWHELCRLAAPGEL
ncbi:flagellar assembly protein FliH [Erwinia billingiae]|jgi:flagellar assembly protein FliH|uniref:Flagellar assembly protein FliH n=1 Tax=Erwinia billingiae (strain Eb661) TaxID=634500 RepID=D8MTN2_ERWBE|nr:flagellar assembly protein FliH [Erwinia billingiae]MBN7120182.1 flagellar assembly protein FliH [Erwinia billingiae]MCX0500723.1 flagellar assembly protein FliH [Erwinia billingiae]PRB60373.1 flagellar assembly protein FliH [Erwinia billingiae]QEW31751.1 flagellar assembly protein FliH [Erwinia billingiae]CAX60189.1 Flagellar assembly protein [Erwinia billingiae Eb661]